MLELDDGDPALGIRHRAERLTAEFRKHALQLGKRLIASGRGFVWQAHGCSVATSISTPALVSRTRSSTDMRLIMMVSPATQVSARASFFARTIRSTVSCSLLAVTVTW